ncbi:MAG: cytochrome c biogenesis protein, partial [Thermoguttaceae bacterium]
ESDIITESDKIAVSDKVKESDKTRIINTMSADVGDNSTKLARNTIRDLSTAYRPGQMTELAKALRETANRMEPTRALVLPPDQIDKEILRKTAYPAVGATNAEYTYYRLNPFHWMWVNAAFAVAFLLASMILGLVVRNFNSLSSKLVDRLNLFVRITIWLGILFLLFSILVTFIGAAMRAYISGWAPVSNMYETIVLMAFFAACLGFWFTMQPILGPVLSRAWSLAAFPKKTRKIIYAFLNKSVRDDTALAQENQNRVENYLQRHLNFIWIIRGILMLLTFWVVIFASYHEYSGDMGIAGAVFRSFMMNDPIDGAVVIVSITAIVWFVPRFFLTCALFLIILTFSLFDANFNSKDAIQIEPDIHPDSEIRTAIASQIIAETQTSSEAQASTEQADTPNASKTHHYPITLNVARLKRVTEQILNRKIFVFVGALIVLIVGVITELNAKEFNPNIRPLVAVLRSNFWLAAHVIVIVISYASGLIAWFLALASLGAYTFGHYSWRQVTVAEVNTGNVVRQDYVFTNPTFCYMLSPYIISMIRVAVWMLMVGTILGARWADYSWGRFWSWDVKEVWALIALLVYLTVLHGWLARLYNGIGISVGAVIGAIAIVMTWYGFNFVFNVGRHSYAN